MRLNVVAYCQFCNVGYDDDFVADDVAAGIPFVLKCRICNNTIATVSEAKK